MADVIYKVVGLRYGRRTSYIAFNRQILCTFYQQGEWTEAPVGYLFAFRDRECAERWIETMRTLNRHAVPDECELWAAQGEDKSEYTPMYIPNAYSVNVHVWWKDILEGRPNMYWRGGCLAPDAIPDGTVLYKKIRLVKLIKYYGRGE